MSGCEDPDQVASGSLGPVEDIRLKVSHLIVAVILNTFLKSYCSLSTAFFTQQHSADECGGGGLALLGRGLWS
jgi:hypothetical protein